MHTIQGQTTNFLARIRLKSKFKGALNERGQGYNSLDCY